MSYIITNNKHYKNIANAIRSKLRVETKYTPEEMASAIGNIPSSADGTNDPVAGIYFTDPDENRNVTAVKMVGLKHDSMPYVFDFNNVREYVKKVEFINCHFTQISDNAFINCFSLEEAPIPEGVRTIAYKSYQGCKSIKSIKIPSSVREIRDYAFSYSDSLISIDLGNVVTLGAFAFANCTQLKDIFFPNTLKSVGVNLFIWGGSMLTNITLGDDFDCNNLDISLGKRYSHDTILSWFNALKDRTGEASYKLIIGDYNLKKMTKEEIAIATNKNWIIV